MAEIYSFAKSVQGASHIKREQAEENLSIGRKFPCQDSSDCEYVEKGKYGNRSPYLITCVCDGHGGSAYFRSELGSRFAVEAMKEVVSESIDQVAAKVDFENISAINEVVKSSVIKQVVSLWGTKVKNHLESNPITDVEKIYLSKEDSKALAKYELGKDLNSIYGATALCFVVAGEKSFAEKNNDFWFAFQIGDGDVCIKQNGTWTKPIPEDDSLFLNQTTSICDSNALSEFRISAGVSKPEAVLCSTDGLANCFANDEQLYGFHDKVLWLFRNWDSVDSSEIIEKKFLGSFTLSQEKYNKHIDNVLNEISNSLPDLSKRGSGDDISLAGYVSVDLLKVKEHIQSKGCVEAGKKLKSKNLKKHFNEIVKLYTDAGKNGYPEGWYELGVLYSELLDSKNVKPDVEKKIIEHSLLAFEKAFSDGWTDGKENYANMLYLSALKKQSQEVHDSAFAEFEKSAKYGNAQAQYAVSLYYGRPQDYPNCGIKQNIAKALDWTMKAANQGHPDAECKLGKCFRDGRGVMKNEEQALEWYKKAALHGNKEAIDYLSSLGVQIKSIPIDKNKNEIIDRGVDDLISRLEISNKKSQENLLKKIQEKEKELFGRNPRKISYIIFAVLICFISLFLIIRFLFYISVFNNEKTESIPKTEVQDLEMNKPEINDVENIDDVESVKSKQIDITVI